MGNAQRILEQHGYTKMKTIGSGSFGKAILVKSKTDGENYIIKEIKLVRPYILLKTLMNIRQKLWFYFMRPNFDCFYLFYLCFLQKTVQSLIDAENELQVLTKLNHKYIVTYKESFAGISLCVTWTRLITCIYIHLLAHT